MALIIRDIQIKAIIRYHYTLTNMAKIKTTNKYQVLERM